MGVGLEREVGAHAKRICPQFSGGNPLVDHELGTGVWACSGKPEGPTCFECSRGESLLKELEELIIKVFFHSESL